VAIIVDNISRRFVATVDTVITQFVTIVDTISSAAIVDILKILLIGDLANVACLCLFRKHVTKATTVELCCREQVGQVGYRL